MLMQKLQANKIMFLTKKFSFDAAHQLFKHAGKCKNLHGHTYCLEVSVTGKINSKTDMIIDFGILKKIVNDLILEKLDHQYLNNLIKNPTAENMIKLVWRTLSKALKREGVKLYKIKLWETPTSCVVYKRG